MQEENPADIYPKRWLITGGCGFIGVNLVKCLVEEKGHFIRIIDNLSVGSRDDLARVCDFFEATPSGISLESPLASQQVAPESKPPSKVQLIVGDILDAELAVQVTKNIDIIVHLAANTGVGPSVEDPRSDCMANVIGTFNYLDAARQRKVKRFILASSGAPVGECEPPIHEEIAPHPVSPYGASKLAGEGYCSAYFRTFGVETVSLRFGNVYGVYSGLKNSVVAKFIKRALEGKLLEIYGDGAQTRDFIFVEDLIHAIRLAAAVKDVGGEVFQIATNSETTVNEISKHLIQILKVAGIDNIELKYSSPRLGDVKRNFSDTTKAKNKLKWQAQTDLSDGLKKTVNWFLSRHV